MWISRTQATRVAPLVLLVLAACKGDESKPKAEKPPVGDEEPAAIELADGAVHALGIRRPTLTLLLPGEEPRRVPAYASAGKGRVANLALEIAPEGLPPEMKISIDLKVAWKPVSGGDGERRSFTVLSAKADPGPPAMSDGERQALEAMEKVFGEIAGQALIVAPHHVAIAQRKGLPSSPSLPWLLHQLIVPMPAFEVGKGARWSVLQGTVFPDGLIGRDERMYELREIDDEGATVQVAGKIELEPEPQGPSTNKPLSAAITVHGELRVGFADVLPISGQLTIVQEMKVQAARPGSPPHEEGAQEQTVRSTVRAKLSSE
jgi:hypothetical protein